MIKKLASSEIVAADSPVHGLNTETSSKFESATNSLSKSLFNSLRPENADKTDNDDNNDQSSDEYENVDEDDNDDYDETIHSIENVDPETLLHTLTHKEQAEGKPKSPNAARIEKTGSGKISQFIEHLDGDSAMKALIPGPPRDLDAQLLNRYVTLSWLEPAKNPDEVISYTVFYRMSSSERLVFDYCQKCILRLLCSSNFTMIQFYFHAIFGVPSERKITTKSRDEQTVIVQSVLPGKTYHFRVVGNSNHGPGESSKTFVLTTQPSENIAGPVQNVHAQALDHKSVLVRWEPPLLANGNITKYRIYYSEPDGDDMYADSRGTDADISLNDLHPYTEYSISVVPFNENGMGDTSNEVTAKTYSSIPSEAPLNVTLEATSSTVSLFS